MKTYKDKALILFDSECNFCNSSIQFIISRDKKDYFIFSSLQSITARQILNELNYYNSNTETIILIQNRKIYYKSNAILNILRHLRGMWLIECVFIIIPKFLRDLVYDFIANHRYLWINKKNICYVPDKSIENKFI